ncbi:heparinase II/III family protein [Mesobacillus maritimus]|uniref:heparinase II/III domain-containing protein n=1 Tax=Mesobacillus maritimus TaxID=1643336 RepID=UPI00384B196F
MFDDIPKIKANISDIDNLEFTFDSPYFLTVTWEDVNFDFYISLKSTSNKIMFFGNGAYDSEKMSLPVFQRHSWANEINESVIVYNDPTLYLGKMNLGWGQGTTERFYIKDLSQIITKLISHLGIDNTNVLFYGSSAGGFQSLYLAGLIRGSKALVNNPQTAVHKYYPSHVKKMYSYSYPGLEQSNIEDKYIERLDVAEFYKSINYIPDIYYLQNLACKHDVQNHLLPFQNSLEKLRGKVDISRIRFEYYHNEEQGHNPLDKSVTLKYLSEFSGVNQSDVTIKQLETSKIIKISNKSHETIDIANKIMQNQIYLFASLDLIDFSNGFNWDYQHHTNPQTYQLYLQALNPISFLLNAVEATDDISYLYKAKEIVESWYDYQSTKPNNTMVWYDHTIAYRAHNLVYYMLLAKKYKLDFDEKKYISLIEQHADYLWSDGSYRKNNHGIMMDRALILLGMLLEHPESSHWIEKGIWRLKDTFYSSYSSNGVHLGNSPEYHRIVSNLYKSTEAFLEQNNLTLGEDLLAILSKSERYFSYLSKPDGSIPMLGDSGELFSSKENKEFESFYDQTAGITILQSKDKQDKDLSTWVSFVCGYGTTAHKHYDDLSFTLFYKGKDIFVDSGKYGYGSSKVRSYVVSPSAHNTLFIKNKRYNLDKIDNDFKNIYTSSFLTTNRVDMVKGINMGYDGVKLERTLIFIKPNILVILDSFNNETSNPISQLFNLAPHIEILDYKNERAKIKSDDEIIEIEQILPEGSFEVHNGSEEVPKAVIAKQFGKVIKTNQLEYTTEKKEGHLLTVVKLGESAVKNFKSASINEKSGLVTINANGEQFNIYI